MDKTNRPLFETGRLGATPGALKALYQAGQQPSDIVRRHVAGDWSELPQEDKELNRAAVQNGGRILSAYDLRSGVKVWVMTESDRSTTTILLPEEY